ncbi:MAG: hypothetical protein K6T76_00185 [Alicyclobacillus mali]|uniref:PepSY domain-containing protein n=1 Tax=Alicyclobacillus mali (ex Roth et al. 2021) TaxID=1123961 RepID=UPI0023F5581A|nr:hypothetical protein [Alicyclobacillus mali (ex Roth et al. 2021)]MCL6487345.1 hypothetical protein [Alicyclobacillus mali (ex Roth et al. 2021)]
MRIQKLLLSAASVCTLSLFCPPAWAADGLQRSGAGPDSIGHPHFGRPVMDSHMGGGRDWDIKSSVQVTREALREAYLASQDAWTSKLQKYAKCSPADAEKAIRSAHPGMKVSEVHLRNIHTSLVYVGFAEDQEDRYLVVVDAGNGKVLLDKPVPTHQERVFAGDN